MPKIAEGSLTGDPAESACLRACDSYRTVATLARMVGEEIDEITANGIPVVIEAEDSLVTTIDSVLSQVTKAS